MKMGPATECQEEGDATTTTGERQLGEKKGATMAEKRATREGRQVGCRATVAVEEG